MTHFSTMSPKDGDTTLCAAAGSVVGALDQIPAPRALCELRTNENDYHWLCTWAATLSRRTVRWWLDPARAGAPLGSPSTVTLYEGAGTLFLLLAAEVARREAREGFVWAAVQERFRPDTRRLLFVQGQPTERLKDALEAACRALRLRHVFGMEGTQSYYVSIYLQFGFTRRGMVRLPFWLAGQGQSEATLSLLDPATGSPSFQNLWRALRDYRRKNIVEERLRRVIAESPWVLPEWADELVHQARQKLDLGTVDAAQAATDTGSIIPFLDQPRLVWDPPHQPHFVSRLVNLAALDLSAERYHVLVGTKPVGSLLRQPDETYDIPEHVVLPSTSAQHSASLLDESGQTLTTGELTLWEPLEDVTVYELPSGRRLDAWRDSLAPHKSYVLMTAADLEVRPTPSQWCLTGDGTRRFVSLPSGWSAELQVVLDGEVLWTPYIGPGRRAGTPEPVWARSVRVHCGAEPTVKLGDRVDPVVVGLGEKTVLTFVRVGTHALDFVQDGSSARVDGLEVTPDIVAPQLAFTLGLRHRDESARVERAPEVDIVGTARLGAAGWETVTASSVVTVHEAATNLYKLFLPGKWAGEGFRDLALLEGTTFSRRLWRIPRPPGALAGFGAPLQVRRGPYNATKTLLTLAKKVVDPGIVRDMTLLGDGMLDLHLAQPLEPGPGHQVICWPLGGIPEVISADQLSVVDATRWRIAYTPADPGRLVVGVGYGGHRLGAWWPDQVECEEGDPSPFASEALPAASTAALIRWMHLPILDSSYLPIVRSAAHTRAAETLAAWLLDEGLPDALQPDAPSEEWISAVRHVFLGWTPTPERVRDVVHVLSQETAAEPLVGVVQHLLRVNPLLMGRVILVWLTKVAPPAGGCAAAVAQVQALRRYVAGLSPCVSDAVLATRQKESLDQAASVMQVDQRFLTDGIVKRALANTLEKVDRLNLYVALGVAPFREYFGLRVLGEMANMM